MQKSSSGQNLFEFATNEVVVENVFDKIVADTWPSKANVVMLNDGLTGHQIQLGVYFCEPRHGSNAGSKRHGRQISNDFWSFLKVFGDHYGVIWVPCESRKFNEKFKKLEVGPVEEQVLREFEVGCRNSVIGSDLFVSIDPVDSTGSGGAIELANQIGLPSIFLIHEPSEQTPSIRARRGRFRVPDTGASTTIERMRFYYENVGPYLAAVLPQVIIRHHRWNSLTEANKNYPDRLFYSRLIRQISRERLAVMLGVSEATICMLETNPRYWMCISRSIFEELATLISLNKSTFEGAPDLVQVRKRLSHESARNLRFVYYGNARVSSEKAVLNAWSSYLINMRKETAVDTKLRGEVLPVSKRDWRLRLRKPLANE